MTYQEKAIEIRKLASEYLSSFSFDSDVADALNKILDILDQPTQEDNSEEHY